MKTIKQLTKILTFITVLLLSTTMSIAQNGTTSDDLSKELAELKAEKSTVLQLINDGNLILIESKVQKLFGFEQVVTLQELTDSLRNRVLYNKGMYFDIEGDFRKLDIPAAIEYILSFSNEVKNQLRNSVVPGIESRIREIEHALDQNGVNNANRSSESINSNSSAFDQTIEQLTSDEHLDLLSFDNISDESPNTTNQNPNVRYNKEGAGPMCLETNPDPSSNLHTFDTNNNPNDQTYIRCGYFKDGWLKYQYNYVDGKEDGLRLSYVTKTKSGRYLSTKIIFRAGERVYLWTYSSDNQGNVFKLNEVAYSSGIVSASTSWHSNGYKSSYKEYKPNGEPDREKKWNINGELIYCTVWSKNGYPNSSKENCNW